MSPARIAILLLGAVLLLGAGFAVFWYADLPAEWIRVGLMFLVVGSAGLIVGLQKDTD